MIVPEAMDMALCGGCGRHMALRNLQLHSRNDDDNEKLLHNYLFCNFFMLLSMFMVGSLEEVD